MSTPSPETNSPASPIFLPPMVRPIETQKQAQQFVEKVWHNDPFVIEHLYGKFSGSSKLWELGDCGGGYIAAYINPGRWCEIGVSIVDPEFMGQKNYWRHFAMIQYVMDAYDLLRMCSHVGRSNAAAHKLNKAIGLRPVGIVEDWGYTKDGVLEDAVVYQLTRREVFA